MIVHANPWFRVVQEGAFFFVEEPAAKNGAAVLPLQGDRVVLLEQHRPAQGEPTLEIPRGYADPGETAAECGARELAEETGLSVPADALISLGHVRPNTALLSSKVALFLARVPDGQAIRVCPDEARGYQTVPVGELAQWLADGRIEDSFTLSALAQLMARYSYCSGV